LGKKWRAGSAVTKTVWEKDPSLMLEKGDPTLNLEGETEGGKGRKKEPVCELNR